MMATGPKVVFDCVVYAQAIISARGPAGASMDLVFAGKLRLAWSDYVLQEIRELPGKLPSRLQVTSERVEAFLASVAPYVEYVATVRAAYTNPFDVDDSHYVDLAIASGATIITSRDRDLLRLMDENFPEGRDFRARFSTLEIITPEVLLQRVGRA